MRMRLPVLLLDDDRDWLQICSTSLPQDSYALIPTTSLDDALERLATMRYPVVIYDQRLIGVGERGGFELLDKAKTCSRFTRVIIVTAYGGAASDIAREAWLKGAHTYLTKPLDFAEVDKCVIRAIQTWRQKVEILVKGGLLTSGPELEFLRILGVNIELPPAPSPPPVIVQPDASIARIHTADGGTVGAGFLVSDRRILTCAHVITAALGLPGDTSDPSQADIGIDFPLVAPEKTLPARVSHWQPASDVAGLELSSAPPPGSKPVRLVTASDMWEHPFRVFGFPVRYDQGVWASGVLRGRRADGWLQVEDVRETGYRIAPGFSGSPVWDNMLNGVVGMIVAADTGERVRAAFLIPTDVLMKAWPDLAHNQRGNV